MEENFKQETNLYSLIKRGNNEDDIISAIENFGLNNRIKGNTSLFFASVFNKPNVVKFLISNGVDINALSEDDYSALMAAVEEENIEIVSILIKAKIDINLKDKHGNNALWKATFNENEEIIKLLLENGADPYERLSGGETIYESAQRMGLETSLKIFDKYKK